MALQGTATGVVEKKYAALIEECYRTEGDERSRTNPGHGYPAETVCYTSVRKFKDLKDMQDFVERESKYSFKSKYQLICYTELVVETEIKIKIK